MRLILNYFPTKYNDFHPENFPKNPSLNSYSTGSERGLGRWKVCNFSLARLCSESNLNLAVRSNLKKMCKLTKIIKFVSLDKFGGSRRENNEKYEVYHWNISCLKYNFWQILSWLKQSMMKSEISVRFVKSLNFTNLENFGDSWGENDASWNVDHGNQCCLKWHFRQL